MNCISNKSVTWSIGLFSLIYICLVKLCQAVDKHADKKQKQAEWQKRHEERQKLRDLQS